MSIFRSIRFNVILFLVIAFLAALGSWIPQVTDSAEQVSAFMAHHPLWGQALNAWGVFDVYHTFLFAGLLALMAFDVVVCKLANKPPDPGLIALADHAEADEVSLRALRKKPFRLEGTVAGSVAGVSKTLLRHFKKQGYAVKKVELTGGGLAVVASRHRLQRWGSYVSHISLVVILSGAMLRSLFGFETMLPILEGQSARVTAPLLAELETDESAPDPAESTLTQQLNALARWPKRLSAMFQHHSLDPLAKWTIAVDKFTVDFYPGSTTPSTFASHVHLFDGDQPLANTDIRVNQPLDVRHVRFYQASWGVTGMIRGAILEVNGKTIELGMKESFPVPGEPWTARVEHYLPEFTIGEDGQPTTASLEWKNPALILGFYNKKRMRIGTLALSAPSPVTPPEAEPWGLFFFEGGHLPVHPPFHVLSVKPVLFSGLQVSYDPGFPVIVVGVLSMLAGLMALFYLHQRRILIFLRPGAEASEVRMEVGGWSSRGEKQFGREFQSLFRSYGLKANPS